MPDVTIAVLQVHFKIVNSQVHLEFRTQISTLIRFIHEIHENKKVRKDRRKEDAKKEGKYGKMKRRKHTWKDRRMNTREKRMRERIEQRDMRKERREHKKIEGQKKGMKKIKGRCLCSTSKICDSGGLPASSLMLPAAAVSANTDRGAGQR